MTSNKIKTDQHFRYLSAITSSGNLTIGNYIGSILPNLQIQGSKNELIMFVANLHAITTPDYRNDGKFLERQEEMLRFYYALGFNHANTYVFYQSDVLEHTSLAYILACHSNLGELQRMTQFKDKQAKIKMANNTEIQPTGLLIYPVLMAADILLYSPNYVIVGEDQQQHLELTRNLAERINSLTKQKIFTIPETRTPKTGARVMSLSDPTKKMSKSDKDLNSSIFLSDSLDQVTKKIAKAVTDSENLIKFDKENKPGVSNLLSIIAALESKSVEQIVEELKGQSYKVLKTRVVTAIWTHLEPIQNRLKDITSQELQKFTAKGTKFAKETASILLKKVMDATGLKYNI